MTHFCPVTGLEVAADPRWVSRPLTDALSINFFIIGQAIVYSRPVGIITLNQLKRALRINEKVVDRIGVQTAKYIQIEDYAHLKNVSIDARKYYIDYVNANDRLLGMIFCNLSTMMQLAVKIGKRFIRSGRNIQAEANYPTAIDRALKICDANNIDKGRFVFGKPVCYGPDCSYLKPVPLHESDEWTFQTADYSNKIVMIDNRIFHSTPSGSPREEHIPMIDHARRLVHKSAPSDARIDYIVVDASGLKALNRRIRHRFSRTLINWHRELPFKMYILYGVNPFIATAVKMANPFMPFRLEVAKDMNHVFELIRQDARSPHDHRKGTSGRRDQPIQSYVDELLAFIGAIDWEQEGMTASEADMAPSHPFLPVFKAIRLIKDELDDLFVKRRENEAKLRESEEKFSNLFLHSNDGIFIHDLEGNILDVNNKVLELFGYTREEMLSMPIYALHSTEALEKAEWAFENIIRDGSINFEIEFQKKTDERFTAEISSRLFEIGGRRIVQGIVRDLTTHKQAEAVLRKYQHIVDSSTDLLALVDREYRYQAVNKTFLMAHDKTRKQIIGRHVEQFSDIGLFDSRLKPLMAQCLSGEPAQIESWMDFDGWGKRYMDLKLYPFVNETWEIAGIVINGRDITETKQLEAQLIQSQKFEAIGTLAGGVAHDFNNYLTTILGCVDLMELKKDDPRASLKYIGEIRNAAERSASLTQRLLAFSRRQVLEKKPANLNAVLSNIHKMLHRLIGEDIELVLKPDPHLRQINADPGQMEQVIMNMAVNARDAMPNGGRLGISTAMATVDESYCRQVSYARPGEFVCLLVEDTGCGMNRELMDKIFDPFFTTKAKGRGTGLGLSVAYGVVKQHNGWINVYSEPGHGTLFKTYLPVITETGIVIEKGTHQDAPDRSAEYKGRQERILLIEDQDEVREMITEALSLNGYIVCEAASLEAARSMIEDGSQTFDLLFSDVILPDGNGIEFAQSVSLKHPGIRILLSSGYTEEKARQDEIAKNHFHFLQKPYPLEKMLKLVSEMLTQ